MFCLARLFYWLLILPIVLFYHGRFLQCLMYRLAIFISDLCVVFFLLHFLESCCRAAAQLQCIQCMDTMETIGNENTSSKRSFWYERAHTQGIRIGTDLARCVFCQMYVAQFISTDRQSFQHMFSPYFGSLSCPFRFTNIEPHSWMLMDFELNKILASLNHFAESAKRKP